MQPGAEKFHGMDGLVRGVPKHSVRPVVDGIVTGVPRNPRPALGTPTSGCMTSATKVPHAAFGSGIFQEGAGAAHHSAPAPEKKAKGTTKGEPRKTARRAYEK